MERDDLDLTLNYPVKGWVLTKAHTDHSSFTVVRIYAQKDLAERDLKLVVEDTYMMWELHEVEWIGGAGREMMEITLRALRSVRS